MFVYWLEDIKSFKLFEILYNISICFTCDYDISVIILHLEKSNEECVAILKTNISRSQTYQLRPCSDRLNLLCYNENYRSKCICQPILYILQSLFNNLACLSFRSSSTAFCATIIKSTVKRSSNHLQVITAKQ